MATINRIRWMPSLIRLFFMVFFLYYLAVVWKDYPFSVGGSLVFVSIMLIDTYLSFVYKALDYELSLVSLILLPLIILNFLSYIEVNNGLSDVVLVASFICALLMLYATYLLSTIPLGTKEKARSSLEFLLWRKVHQIIGHIVVIMLSVLVMTFSMFKAMEDLHKLPSNLIYNFPLLVMICFVLTVTFVFLYMAKWRYLDSYISILVESKAEVDIAKIKKWLITIALGSLLMGSGLEIGRGFWLLWIITWLLFVVILALFWKTWKFVFQKRAVETIPLDEEYVAKLPSFTNPHYLLKFVGFFWIILLVYIFIFVFSAISMRH